MTFRVTASRLIEADNEEIAAELAAECFAQDPPGRHEFEIEAELTADEVAEALQAAFDEHIDRKIDERIEDRAFRRDRA